MFSEENPKTTIFLNTSLFILYLGQIIYIIFGIIYLVKDYEIAEKCNQSNLWLYILISLLFSFFNLNIKSNNENNNNIALIITIIIGFMTNLSFCIWGGLELFQYSHSCTDLLNSHLWTIGFISFIMQLIVCFIFICIPIFTLCYISLKKNEQNIINEI